ncbi:MAG: hypothetical protein KKH28_12045 [Elusimicrobia bacterium]|nr:hypothetical protein [Elusimicrobiota bacterium]
MVKIIDWVLSLNLFMGMATLTKADFNVYVDNKLDNSISVYQRTADEYIVLLGDYSLKDGKGVYYVDLKRKTVVLLIGVKKLELKDTSKLMKINKSSMESLNFIQIVDDELRHLKMTTDEIRFTPDCGLLGRDPGQIDRLNKKEVILRRRQTNQL